MTTLRGVGAALAERLARLGVARVADLLFVLPLRYEDRTRVVPLGTLAPGTRAAVEGEVQLTEVAYRGRRQLLTPHLRRLRHADAALLLFLRAASRPTWRAARACAPSAKCAAGRWAWRWCTPSTGA